MLWKRNKRKKRKRLMICWPTSMILSELIIGRISRGSWVRVRWVLEEEEALERLGMVVMVCFD
jgi:hypothetical protein